MNKNPPKLKPVPRPLFTCGIFRNCTQSVLSPTAAPPSSIPPTPPPPPPPPPPSDQLPPPPPPPPQPSSSSSSSSSTSPSFTQWRFPLHHPPNSAEHSASPSLTQASSGGGDVFSAAEAPVAALRFLERGMSAANSESVCPPEVMAGVTAALRDPVTARPAAKVLLAMVLVEPNRRAAVEAGAVEAAVEAIVASGGASATGTSTAERALAALELMCTTEEGLLQVRNHALAAPAISGAVEGMQGRGRECGIGVLAAAFGDEKAAKDSPDEVVRAVVVAMQGECSARGRRKGAMLMRAWQDCGRLDLNVNFDGW